MVKGSSSTEQSSNMISMEASGSLMKLTEWNYPSWKTMMEDYLHCHDLYDPVEGDSAKPKEMSDKDWEKLNRKTVAVIRQSIDISLFDHVATETRADEVWKKLEALNERKVTQNKISTLERLVNLKFKEGGNIYTHRDAFLDLVNQLSSMKLAMNDELQALLFMSSLPKSCRQDFVTFCCNDAPNGKLTMKRVKWNISSWRFT